MAFPFGGREYATDLDTPLLRLSPHDTFTLADAFEALLVFGAIGSGKTSGSGKEFAKAYLKSGMGGLVCCAKQGERETWLRYAKETGRWSSVIVLDGSGKHRFNPLQYEMMRSADAGSLITNVVAMLTTVIDAANGNVGQSSGENQFWSKGVREMLTYCLAVLWSAHGRVSLFDLFALIRSRPKTAGQSSDPAWLRTSFMAHTLKLAQERPAHPMHELDYRNARDFLIDTIGVSADARTTGNLLATLSADLAPLMQGQLRELFCSGTTIVPEMTHEGAIIILDLPVKQYGIAGVLAQQIFKFLWQRSVERRSVTPVSRPQFLFCDESHFFLSPYDSEFMSTVRETRTAVVYLTQNLPGIYSRIGGQQPEHAAKALLGNFNTVIAHSNGCSTTNEWMANRIGKGITYRYNGSTSTGNSWGRGGGESMGSGGSSDGKTSSGNWNHTENSSWNTGGNISQNAGYAENMDLVVQASHFTRLRKGGRVNKYNVDAVLFQTGKTFRHSGTTWLSTIFKQR